MPIHRPFTTRRGFLATLSFGAISLYGVWESLDTGAEPAAGASHNGAHDADPAPTAAGHEGHGASDSGTSTKEFERLAREFIARHARADGSVEPLGAAAPISSDDDDMEHGASHGMSHEADAEPDGGDDASVAIDVYLMATQWAYEPAVLHLKAGQPYRFRMMALDASHGASIQLGSGSHVIRLRRGVLVERTMRLEGPGRYLLYCTVYCGAAHDRMSGMIMVS